MTLLRTLGRTSVTGEQVLKCFYSRIVLPRGKGFQKVPTDSQESHVGDNQGPAATKRGREMTHWSTGTMVRTGKGGRALGCVIFRRWFELIDEEIHLGIVAHIMLFFYSRTQMVERKSPLGFSASRLWPPHPSFGSYGPILLAA